MYQVIVSVSSLTHTPKRDLTQPLNSNDLAGSKRLFNFFDSIFAIGRSSKGEDLRYIKQLKVRQCANKYGQDNVLVCRIVKRDDGFLMFDTIGTDSEHEHLKKRNHGGLTEQYGDAIMQLKDKNMSCREIAKELNISKSAVNNIIRSITNNC